MPGVFSVSPVSKSQHAARIRKGRGHVLSFIAYSLPVIHLIASYFNTCKSQSKESRIQILTQGIHVIAQIPLSAQGIEMAACRHIDQTMRLECLQQK